MQPGIENVRDGRTISLDLHPDHETVEDLAAERADQPVRDGRTARRETLRAADPAAYRPSSGVPELTEAP
jgi:hypothetical protein